MDRLTFTKNELIATVKTIFHSFQFLGKNKSWKTCDVMFSKKSNNFIRIIFTYFE